MYEFINQNRVLVAVMFLILSIHSSAIAFFLVVKANGYDYKNNRGEFWMLFAVSVTISVATLCLIASAIMCSFIL